MNLGFKFASIKWCMESESKALLYPPLDQSKWTGQFIQDILRQWSICLIKELFKVEHFEPFIWVISQLGDTFEFYFLPSPINQKSRGNIVSWNFKKKCLTIHLRRKCPWFREVAHLCKVWMFKVPTNLKAFKRKTQLSNLPGECVNGALWLLPLRDDNEASLQ